MSRMQESKCSSAGYAPTRPKCRIFFELMVATLATSCSKTLTTSRPPSSEGSSVPTCMIKPSSKPLPASTLAVSASEHQTKLAAPSHLASLIEARPCVAHLITLANEAGINLPAAQHTYESNVLRAREDCIARLDPGKGRLLVLICDDATENATDRFKDILSGAESMSHHSPHASS